jgi:hypothetical protein
MITEWHDLLVMLMDYDSEDQTVYPYKHHSISTYEYVQLNLWE